MKLKLKPFFPWHDIWQPYPVEIGAKSIFDVLFIVTRFPIPVCYYIWRLAKRGEIGNRLTRFSFQWSSWDEDNLVPESSFLWHLSMILSIFHFLWHLPTNLIDFFTFVTPSPNLINCDTNFSDCSLCTQGPFLLYSAKQEGQSIVLNLSQV